MVEMVVEETRPTLAVVLDEPCRQSLGAALRGSHQLDYAGVLFKTTKQAAVRDLVCTH